MSKYLIELGLEESIEDWLADMRWKLNHNYKAFEATLSECATLLREEIASARAIERARCAEICAEVRRTALRQTTGDMAHANGIAVGAEYCERMIRGDKC